MPNAVEETLDYLPSGTVTVLKIFGILKDGSKTTVLINDAIYYVTY